MPGIGDVVVDVLEALADLLGEVGAEPSAEGVERVREIVPHRQPALDPRGDAPVTLAVLVRGVLPEAVLVHVEEGVYPGLGESVHLILKGIPISCCVLILVYFQFQFPRLGK